MATDLKFDPAAMRGSQSSYAPKLTFDDRCAILAAFVNGVSPRVLAEAYGINRRTVSAITNEHSLHYRDVRQRRKMMGGAEFAAAYITDSVVSRVNAALASPVATMTVRDYEKYAPKFNPRATSEMGVRQWRAQPNEFDAGMAYLHFVEIAIVENNPDPNWNMGGDEGENGMSWGWRDLNDGNSEGRWITGFRTSKAAWAHARDNIVDDPLIVMNKKPMQVLPT